MVSCAVFPLLNVLLSLLFLRRSGRLCRPSRLEYFILLQFAADFNTHQLFPELDDGGHIFHAVTGGAGLLVIGACRFNGKGGKPNVMHIDSDADMIEILSKEISQYNKKVSLGEDINEEFLLDINRLQENTIVLRESIVDKQRVISSILKSQKCPKSIQNKLNIMLKDISSLVNHTNFSFDRLEYLQNTVIGLINLDQNKIMKVFTLVSLLLMPPTLIASFYGMNVALPMIPGDTQWNWVIIVSLMVVSFVIVFLIFKRKKML